MLGSQWMLRPTLFQSVGTEKCVGGGREVGQEGRTTQGGLAVPSVGKGAMDEGAARQEGCWPRTLKHVLFMDQSLGNSRDLAFAPEVIDSTESSCRC